MTDQPSVAEPTAHPEFTHSNIDPLEDVNMIRLLQNEPITDITNDTAERRRVILRASAYQLNGNQLLRRMSNGSTRIVPPADQREELIKKTHEGLVHLGEKRVLHLLQTTYSWPRMARQVHDVLNQCDSCRRAHSLLQGAGDTLHPLRVASLFYRWSIDYCKMPRSKAGYTRVFIAVENLTRFIVLVPTFDKSSLSSCYAFRTHIFGMFGSCAEVVSDHGKEFEGEFDDLLDSLLIDHRHSSSYHPQANGLAERIVQVTKTALKKSALNPKIVNEWEKILPSLMLAYNASRQSRTHLTPYTCVFGQIPVVPPEAKERFTTEFDFNLDNTHDELLATELLRRMELVHRSGVMCAHNLDIAQKQDIQWYKLVHSGSWLPSHAPLKVNDFVILKGEAADTFDLPRRRAIYQVMAFVDPDQIELRGKDDRRFRTHRTNVARYPPENVDQRIEPARHLHCLVCDSQLSQHRMLRCDECNQGYHTYCIDPQLPEVPEGDWICPVCCGQPPPVKKAPRGRGRPRKVALPQPAVAPAVPPPAPPVAY